MIALISSEITGDVRLIRAITFSSYALLVWDYLLTIDDEMMYIWESPFSVVKCFFIGNRYANLLIQPVNISQVVGILPLHSHAACLAYSWGWAFFQLWSYGSVHVLVLLRIWILQGRSRKITIALVVMLILYVCPAMAVLAYILSAISFGTNHATAGTCGARLASFSWLTWVAECTLELCLFGLMVFTLRQQKSAYELSRVPRLVRSLYRHAIIFLLANTLSDIANAMAWTVFLRTPLFDLPSSLPITLVNIAGQRLAIDLRRLHIQKDITRSEVSREVEIQLAAFDDNPGMLSCA